MGRLDHQTLGQTDQTEGTLGQLADGRTVGLNLATYPPTDDFKHQLVTLWQSEWNQTDYDWHQSLRGDYSDSLCIRSVIASIEGTPVATATVNYPVCDPEVAVVGSVMTRPRFRRLGIARRLTNFVTELAFADGCQMAYLGSSWPRNGNVYQQCGYEHFSGCVFRRVRSGREDCERAFFAPGQIATLRQPAWGDLPGFTCLAAQPLDCWVLDYPRGYLSSKHVGPNRCVSCFPYLYDDVRAHEGTMFSLIGNAAHRVLGFGSLTPGPAPGRNHTAILDVAVHDHYLDQLPQLIERLVESGTAMDKYLLAYVADQDQVKKRCLLDAGFSAAGRLPASLRMNGRLLDAIALSKAT